MVPLILILAILIPVIKKDLEAGEEQHEPEVSKAGEPVQQEQTRVEEPEHQPLQPEADKAAGTGQQSNGAPLDSFEQSLLDILDKE